MIKTEDITIKQCTRALEWMISANYKLSVHGSLLNQLIAKCTDSTNGNKPDLKSLKFIHSLITNGSIATMDDDVIIKTVLLNAYGLCEAVDSALDIFHSFSPSERTEATIGAMMKVYVVNDCYSDAFTFYDEHNGNQSNHILHRLALKCCIKSNDYHRGEQIRYKLESENNDNIFIKTALIDFYSHFGDIQSAQKIFDSVPNSQHNIYSINAMIGALLHNQNIEGAMEMMYRFRKYLDEYSFSFLLKWCIDQNREDIGWRVIELIPTKMKMDSGSVYRNLTEFYGTFGDVDAVLTLYRSLKESKGLNSLKIHTHSVNVVLNALLQNGYHQQCLEIYDGSAKCDVLSHCIAIKACIAMNSKSKGYEIMDKLKQISMENDNENRQNIQSLNVRMESYGHFGDVDAAMDIFKSMDSSQSLDKHALSTMMGVFIKNEQCQDALALYDRYWKLHDDIMHVLALKACGQSGHLEEGLEIIRGCKLKESQNVQIKNAMISFYGHCGDIESALDIFHGMKMKDIVTINAMMDAFRHCQRHRECIELFDEMEKYGDLEQCLEPDLVSVIIALKSCAEGTMLHFGRRIHENLKGQIVNDNFGGNINGNINGNVFGKSNANFNRNYNGQRAERLLKDVSVQVNLINMYGKAGAIGDCERIFEEIRSLENDKYRKEIAIWNAMITAYGRNGHILKVKSTYDLLMEIGLIPDKRTYSALITACNHCGDLYAARTIWNEEMDDDTKYDDYVMSAMVDGMVRKGYLEQAVQLLRDKDCRCTAAWMSVMSGCVQQNEVSLANKVYGDVSRIFAYDEKTLAAVSKLQNFRTI